LLIGTLNFAVYLNLKSVETTARIPTAEPKIRSNEEYSRLRRLNEILIEDCNSKKRHYEDMVSNLTSKIHKLEVANSNLKDSRDHLIASQKEFNSKLFEINGRYRAAETDFEISRFKESSLKEQLEAARVREKNLTSRLDQLLHKATLHIRDDVPLRLDTASGSHRQLGKVLLTSHSIREVTAVSLMNRKKQMLHVPNCPCLLSCQNPRPGMPSYIRHLASTIVMEPRSWPARLRPQRLPACRSSK
jgi:hypothetical protein